MAHDQGNDECATALLEESLTLFRDIGHQYGPAFTLSVLGTVAHAQGNDERATALYEESLGLWTAIGFKWGMATTLHRLGAMAHEQGDDDRATALYEERLALRWELGDNHGLAECLEGLAGVAVASSNWSTPRGSWALQRPCAWPQVLPCRPASVSGMTATCLQCDWPG